jgi:low affinity Fe/Cu permease
MEWFSRFAHWVGNQSGRPSTFALAVLVIVVWGITGPIFDWSDTWQLIINTGTTIITFLMVFLIQHTQNRDTQAMQLKLDELIRTNRAARNALIDLENMSEAEVEELRSGFAALCKAKNKTRSLESTSSR